MMATNDSGLRSNMKSLNGMCDENMTGLIALVWVVTRFSGKGLNGCRVKLAMSMFQTLALI